MPRFDLGFDMEQFLNHCRQVKPPYECPVASCGRNYKSYAGISNHMSSFDHENCSLNAATPNSATPEPEPPSIPYSTDMKTVQFELDGKPMQLSVYDQIEIFSKEEYEASLPPVLEEPKTQEQARTPSIKSQSKTPKGRGGNDKEKGVDVQRYTIEDKKSNKLPEAAFTIIDEYYKNLPDAPKQTDAYYKYVEKSPEELDAEVEYDMDEEDSAWLGIINEKRSIDGLDPVPMEDFELMMDRLEKESFFQAQSSGRDSGVPIDEDAVCCICMDGECQNSNVILFCDMCNLAVHQECYGVPYIPEGQWLCRRCLQSPSRAVDCALCPNKGGAFKQTDDGRWGHVVCAMWIPEVCFANTVFLEPIDSIGNIPPARWKLTCYICKQRGVGACIQCNKVNCYTAFHVTCAQQAGLHMKIDAVGETSATGTNVIVRKAAYCDMHTPADSDARPQIEECTDALKKAAAKAASRQKMKKARKILAEKRSAAPVVSVPTIPPKRIQKLAELVTMEKRSQFLHRLLAYWTLKRQSRNGVPLLRRLTSSYPRRNASGTVNKNRSPEQIKPNMKKPKKKEVSVSGLKRKKLKKMDTLKEHEKLKEEIRYWQRLRQDLERARLLCELIRKREKTKRELIKIAAEEKTIQLAPFVHLLVKAVDLIQEKDPQLIFAEPVDFEEVHDYLDVVKHPMDLSTMRQKALGHQYQDVDQFASDFYLMIDNCLTYNSKDTIFYKIAVKLRHQGVSIIRQLRRDVQNIGFDMKTGLLLPHRPKPVPEVSEEKLIEEIENVLKVDLDDCTNLEERERVLLESLDKANSIKNSVSRLSKVKIIRSELGKVRRKLSINHNANLSLSKNTTPSYDTEERVQEDSEVDTNSAIDDEAEPGEPMRPSSPVNNNNRPQQNTETNKKAASTPSTQKKIRRAGRPPNKDDPKQIKIDSFFNKDSSSTSKTNNSTPSNAKSNTEPETPKTEAPRKRGRPPKSRPSLSLSIPEPTTPVTLKTEDEEEKEVQKENSEETEEELSNSLPGSPSGVNRRTSVLFAKKAGAPTKPSSKSEKRSRSRRMSENGPSMSCDSDEDSSTGEKVKSPAPRNKKSHSTDASISVDKVDMNKDSSDRLQILELCDELKPIAKESFKVYRQSGDIPEETDDDTQSESNSSMGDSESESGSDSDSNDDDSDSDSSGHGEKADGTGSLLGGEDIPIEPLDLVWAKCRGYPWYPALIINPKMPRTGYFHNHVPIPVPPEDVLALAAKYETPMYLVLFFDNKRTWQWLPRNKLEPLGVNSDLDKAKLVESRKPAERNAVKKAYEKAILHRCRVAGENTGLSGESDTETQPTT